MSAFTQCRAARAVLAMLVFFAVGLVACSGSTSGGGGSSSGLSSTPGYIIGGTVNSLSGTGLVLLDNGSDSVTINTGGSFRFPVGLNNAAPYAVTIRTQPSSPSQTCTVANGSGIVNGSNVTSVQVNCTTNSYLVGGTVTGLAGSGLVLQLNGGDNIAVGSNPNFTFSTPVASGSHYAVTVLTQPSSPSQTCSVAGGSGGGNDGSGTMGSANVNNIIVSCVTNTSNTLRNVVANVNGWSGTGTAPVLQFNGGSGQSVTNGANALGTLTEGSAYSVTVLSQPTSPSQTCTVANGSGTVSGSNVNVTVTCSSTTYSVGGSVSGLTGSGLQLQLSGGEVLGVSSNNGFTFVNAVANGSPYNVTVRTQPSSPSQSCSVSHASGTVSGSNVSNVQVTCATNLYNVAFTVNGLSGAGLIVRNNGADDVAVNANGSFVFPTAMSSGGNYNVTIAMQPSSPSQTCTLVNAVGIVGNGNVTDVSIYCSVNTYTVSGNISGLSGSGLVLQLNGGDTVSVSSGSGSYAFANAIADGSSYNVTVLAQPSSQTCTVTNGTGTVNGANVSNVALSCSVASWSDIRQFGTSTDDVGNAITVDSTGNIIVGGCMSGALRNNNTNYKNTCDTIGGSASGLVQKYNSAGALQWTRQLSNGVNVEVNAVATDASRNVYVTGFVYGSLDGQIQSGGKDVFLTKFDQSGNKLWTYQFGTVTADQGNALTFDAGGNLYVVGTTFGNLDGNSAGNNYDVFVTRFDAASIGSGAPSGPAWLAQFGTSVADYGLSIAADGSGNLFVSGVTLGALGSSASGMEDVFVAKLSANSGSRSWVQQIGTSGYDYTGGVVTDASGNVYVAGYTTGFSGLGAYDAFVVSYDTNGSQRWLRQLVSPAHDYTTGVAISGNGIYITGYTVGNYDGNTNNDPSGNTSDIFITRYDTSGNKQWSRTLGTATDDRPYAIATDADGGAYVTGYTLGSLDGHANNGGADVFIVKYSTDGIKQ